MFLSDRLCAVVVGVVRRGGGGMETHLVEYEVVQFQVTLLGPDVAPCLAQGEVVRLDTQPSDHSLVHEESPLV